MLMMRITLMVFGLSWASLSFALDNYYCTQGNGYISIGMTENQVIAACGEPITKTNSNKPLMQKVKMTQLNYNNMGAAKAFYGVWALPVGNNAIGNPPFGGNDGGVALQVAIVNDKVYSINLNGDSSNGFSICGGPMIQIGDPGTRVYGSCGTPSLVNQTYIEVPVPSTMKPQVWVYQQGEYQTPVTLTFIEGKLQSIQ